MGEDEGSCSHHWPNHYPHPQLGSESYSVILIRTCFLTLRNEDSRQFLTILWEDFTMFKLNVGI